MSSLILRLLVPAALCGLPACAVGPEPPAFRTGAPAVGRASEARQGSLAAWRALSKGATAVAEGHPELALRHFDQAKLLGVDDPMLFFLRGVAHLDLGQGELAVQQLEQAIAADATDSAAYSALARSWRSLGARETALDVLSVGVEACNGDLRLMVLQGHLLLEAGFLGEAFDTLQEVAARDPRSVDAHRALGVLFSEVGDAGRAELSFRSALRIEPDDPLLLAGLGNALRDLEREEEALACYLAAAAAEPGNAVHLANAGSVLVRLDRLPDARDAYDEALRADRLPPGPRSFVELNLAQVLERMGEEDSALVAYESAATGDPSLGAAHEALGLMLLDRGEEEHSLEHLRSALGTGQISAEAALHLGLLAERRGEPEVTRQCARLLELVGEQDPIAAFRRAQLMVRARDPEVHDPRAAVPILRGLLAGEYAGNGAVWNVLGEALASQGSFEEAARAAEHALGSVDPEHPLARHYRLQRVSYLAHAADG
jgi:tetratricopeptide (TPR) repeat protein